MNIVEIALSLKHEQISQEEARSLFEDLGYTAQEICRIFQGIKNCQKKEKSNENLHHG